MAAASVLFSHAFLIATGTEAGEPFVRLLGPDNIAGLYGVFTFFIISGFLLASSLAHDSSVVRFATNRVLRIYPGFIFCILVVALLLGPLASSLSWRQYLSSPDVTGYITTALSCLCDMATLPGVYAYRASNGLEMVVNGSLWSLSFEVLSYLLLAWFWLALRNVAAVGISLALLAAATAFPMVNDRILGVAYTLPYFAGGVLMYTLYQRLGVRSSWAVCAAVCLLVFAGFGLQKQAYAVFGTYLAVYLGTRPNVFSRFAARFGDLSYGLYLFGWPVEQLMKEVTGTSSPWMLMALSFPPVLALAAVSYHSVERPALRLKKPVGTFIERILAMHHFLNYGAVRLAASLAFLIVAGAILTSKAHWWFVTRSLAEVTGCSILGGTLALVVIEGLRIGRRPSAQASDGPPE